ncbi:hypothetical protein A8C56_21910 [Niabella ginsenosidivorans]|uniref:Uncharacterized protein n=1 Tax=Niabella ginsenosidivorans TaxID=1176587 RepID=A0A1A9I9D4_9BACT|nr:hypothetical protein [Niabella ginsenosidivorans]ANH83281.1 hypothetical protein A8C56_21910 [Niabella ginsenosidivorans]
MDKREKLAVMDKILRELDDLKNSETSVLKKIAQIETENINLGVGLLDKTLPDVHENVDKAIEEIDQIISKFTEHRNKFSKDNKLEESEEAPKV